MAKKYLEAQPNLMPGSGKLYILFCHNGWNGHIVGLDWNAGLANNGVPVNVNSVMRARSCGALFTWFEYVPGIKLEMGDSIPKAYVEIEARGKVDEDIKATTPETPNAKKKRGRPKK